MRPFRFLHAADLHLDSPFRGMVSLPAAIRDRIVDSTFQALQRIIQISIKEKVDFVVFSGDIYDSTSRSLRAQIRFQAAMEQLAAHHIQAFIVHGNHDPEDGAKAALAWPQTVHFFPSDRVAMLPAYDRSGQMVAHVYGMSYPTAVVSDNLALQYQVENHNMYNIALLHCNVDGDQTHEPYAPCTTQQLIASGMDYWALGHVHTRQVMQEDPFIVYPGNTQGRSVRELGAKGCYVVDVSEHGESALFFHRTDVLTWFHETLSIEGMQTEQDVANGLYELVERVRLNAEGRAVLVRVTFEGRGIMHRLLLQEAVREELADLLRQRETTLAQRDQAAPFVWLESMKVTTGSEVEREQLLRQESFLGDMLRMSEALAGGEQLEAFAEQALGTLLNHRQAGKYVKGITLDNKVDWLRAAEEMAIQLLYEDKERER